MIIDDVQQAIQTDSVNITRHARKEAKEDSLKLDHIFFSTLHGKMVETYPMIFRLRVVWFMGIHPRVNRFTACGHLIVKPALRY
jgi:hypothetical protein